MKNKSILVWFREDLRTLDNPALYFAAKKAEQENKKVLFLYIYEKFNKISLNYGSANKWWLHESLKQFNLSLSEFDRSNNELSLNILSGNPKHIIPELCNLNEITHVFWNRRYIFDKQKIDIEVKKILKKNKIEVQSFNGNTLIEPWNIRGKQGQNLKVFTPYKNSLIKNHTIPYPLQKPKKFHTLLIKNNILLDDLNLKNHNWMKKFDKLWIAGENEALKKIDDFINKHISSYHFNRDIMEINGTSKLSPHIHFGEISPKYIWHKIVKDQYFNLQDGEKVFLSEIIWREFAINILTLFPNLDTKNIKSDFDKFEWIDNTYNFNKWKKGETGYPIVDAAMKQLWKTGWMHNRARMIVASFLTKHLLIHWKKGADWFHDTLLDSDLASNYASWQWVAGSGADAAPFFRIFNPTTQSQKFDANGNYIKTYLPVLKTLSNKEVHEPKNFNSNLYPPQIVDHKFARTRALDCFSKLKKIKT